MYHHREARAHRIYGFKSACCEKQVDRHYVAATALWASGWKTWLAHMGQPENDARNLKVGIPLCGQKQSTFREN